MATWYSGDVFLLSVILIFVFFIVGMITGAACMDSSWKTTLLSRNVCRYKLLNTSHRFYCLYGERQDIPLD